MAEGIVLEDVGGEFCEPVAGFVGVLSWALRSDFEAMVEPKSICSDVSGEAAESFAELQVIPAPGHTLKAGKKMNRINYTSETGALTSTMIGNKRNRLFENTLVIEIAGSEAKEAGLMRYIKNKDLIFFAQEFGNGNIRQIGSSRMPAWVEAVEGMIEGPLEGKNAITLTLKDKGLGIAPIYKGPMVYVATP